MGLPRPLTRRTARQTPTGRHTKLMMSADPAWMPLLTGTFMLVPRGTAGPARLSDEINTVSLYSCQKWPLRTNPLSWCYPHWQVNYCEKGFIPLIAAGTVFLRPLPLRYRCRIAVLAVVSLTCMCVREADRHSTLVIEDVAARGTCFLFHPSQKQVTGIGLCD